ncbi:hypothetical protein PN498_26125 [Oscillatoria sp. CS-180]|uniref:hypothetical protein n=1 Tax=Oscillatoria sp. CS-180 TaxID=3021720 RepID=UPI0023310EF0|nr:hypothetical protein [Oscillatoria sp. CS-180]MDB9529495.1 hypothetical protein [Oscillatoria sp. CS-180]
MTAREQLLREIEQAPDSLVNTVLDFYLFVKERQQLQGEAVLAASSGIVGLLKDIKDIQTQVPQEEWDKLPHDGAVNHDHYLYGVPKLEE